MHHREVYRKVENGASNRAQRSVAIRQQSRARDFAALALVERFGGSRERKRRVAHLQVRELVEVRAQEVERLLQVVRRIGRDAGNLKRLECDQRGGHRGRVSRANSQRRWTCRLTRCTNMHERNVEFEWDPNETSTNLSKHGVRFAEAATVFEDEGALTMSDDEPDEER